MTTHAPSRWMMLLVTALLIVTTPAFAQKKKEGNAFTGPRRTGGAPPGAENGKTPSRKSWYPFRGNRQTLAFSRRSRETMWCLRRTGTRSCTR